MLNSSELEIIIPTYNRKAKLRRTLDLMLGLDSPVRNCSITILNNCSNDGTFEMLEDYASKYPNLKFITNVRNIGGDANITRCYEIASKKYVWVVGDDDSYDFTHFDEVENAIREEYDAIVVADFHLIQKPYHIGNIMNQLSLISAGIFKTENITIDVIQNAYLNIMNLFPHMSLITALVNKNARFFVTSSPITIWCPETTLSHKQLTLRGYSDPSNAHSRRANSGLTHCWFNSLEMIKDKNLRSYLVNNHHKLSKLTNNLNFYSFISNELRENKKSRENDLHNLFELYWQLNLVNKSIFIFSLIIPYKVLKSFSNLFFSIKNENFHRVYRIFGIKFKIRTGGGGQP